MLKNYMGEEKYLKIKNSSNVFYKALEIVSILFENDKDKGGWPYILHLISVYKKVSEENEKIIALLHDVIEDKNVSEQDLLDIGFSKEIVESVKLISKSQEISYEEYIHNLIINGSKHILRVKMADLENNMDISRISNAAEKDYERIEKKYKPAYLRIKNRLEEMER
ncbi:MAG: hypothetical protein E7161_02275 [Firmicutes bacterium]|nr:hypothetical protein [Bacillota bacterium]